MSKVDINTINDEEELHKMLSSTEDFDERKKIRNRLKEIRDKARGEFEEKRKQRDAAAGDLVKLQHDRAEELKRKKMAAFQEAAAVPTSARESDYTKVSEKGLLDRHRQADEDKKKKLEAYSKISGHHGTSTTSSSTTTTNDGATVTINATVSTEKSEDGAKTTVTKRTETTVSKTSGMGGMQYGAPGKAAAEQVASQLTKQLISSSGPGVSGRVTVKTESWSSRDGLVNKSEKTETWGGAKPQGARGAMAAFKQMDNTSNPQAANKPKAGGGGGGKPMTRSPSAIKQMLLDWCKAKTAEYENVEITNFSSSWNNGMAFCALIHHFYPDSFDFSSLDPKKRRENFTLAFDTAEKQADIAPLLDVDDMVKMKNPDWKCVFCYVQSIYRHLHNHDANKAKEAAEQ